MTSRFEVVKGSRWRWPSGDYRAAAVLRLEPDEFAARFGVGLARGIDDLDYYRAALLELASGRRVDLVQYRGNRGHGTTVHADAADDLGAALTELLEVLALGRDAVSWTPDRAVGVAGVHDGVQDAA